MRERGGVQRRGPGGGEGEEGRGGEGGCRDVEVAGERVAVGWWRWRRWVAEGVGCGESERRRGRVEG